MKRFLFLFYGLAFSVISFSQYVAGETYFGDNDYIEYRAGNLPIIIVAPHAGTLVPEELPDIHDRGADNGTLETTRDLWDTLYSQTNGCYPHIIFCHLHPSKLNAVDEIDSAAGTHPVARNAWEEFHEFIEIAKEQVTIDWGKGHYFEMHGNGHAEMWNEIGLGVSKVYLNDSDEAILSRLPYSTVKNLCTEGGADFLEIIKGETSLGGLLQERGWKSVPSPTHPAPEDGGFFFAGWNTWLHGSRYDGTIDATHLENYYVFMQIANRAEYTHDLAASILIFMETHYGFTLNCEDLSVPKGTTGETYFYPNPVKLGSQLNFQINEPIKSIQVYDLQGRFVPLRIEKDFVFIRPDLQPGIYFVMLTFEDGEQRMGRIVVQ